jgi:hypothetical protein
MIHPPHTAPSLRLTREASVIIPRGFCDYSKGHRQENASLWNRHHRLTLRGYKADRSRRVSDPLYRTPFDAQSGGVLVMNLLTIPARPCPD